MRKCPNCGQPTARTEDWACQWCGYPLTSNSYKKIPKTFKQLQEERERKKIEVKGSEEIPEPRRHVTTPEPVPRYIPPPEFTAPRRVEPVPAPRTEPVAPPKIEPPPQPRLGPMPPRRVEPTPTPEPELVPPPRVEAPLQPEVEPAPAPRIETAPPPVVPVLEAKAEPAPPPAPEAAEPDPEAPPGVIGITVQRLCAAHKSDRAAAMARFKDTVIRVAGLVGKVVVRDELGIRYAILNGNNDINVRCTLDPQYANRLMKLTPKQRVIVQGKYDGYERNILLKDCILVSP